MAKRITTFDDPAILSEAIHLYQVAGIPTPDLANKYGCSTHVIIKTLRNAGVTIRARGGQYIEGATRPAGTKQPRKSPTLPRALAYEDMPWVKDARCRTDGTPEMFFPGTGQARLNKYAKAICNACPVMRQCRDWALVNSEEWGVWVGLTERERRAIIRDRKKAAA